MGAKHQKLESANRDPVHHFASQLAGHLGFSPVQMIFHISLRPEPGNWRAPVDKRLALALKVLLRSFGMRCVNIREELSEKPHNDLTHTNTPPVSKSPQASQACNEAKA